MRVLVLGSGVVGVTSAYYLARQGHEVTVVDRQPAAGMETSFANAGQVSPGYSAPWAAPGIPIKAMKWLMMKHRPLVLWPRTELRLWGWLAHMLANCTEEAYRRNKSRMVSLAEYSRDCLRDCGRRLASPMTIGSRGFSSFSARRSSSTESVRTRPFSMPMACPTRSWIPQDASASNQRWVSSRARLPAACVSSAMRLAMPTCLPSGSPPLLSNWGPVPYGTSVQKVLTEGERISGVQVNGGRCSPLTPMWRPWAATRRNW